MDIKHLIFDLGNVIIPLDEARTWDTISSWCTDGVFERLVKEVFQPYEKGLIADETMINRIQARAHTTPSPRQTIRAWNAMLLDIPAHRMDMLKRLKNDYHISILSNTNALHFQWVQNTLRSRYQVDDFSPLYAHHSFYSHNVHLRKPDPAIYEHVAEVTGIPPDQSYFFDDKIENVNAARTQGFQARQIEAGEEVADVLRQLGLIKL